MSAGCPSLERLQGLLGEDPGTHAEANSIARHVEECSRCQELLEQLTQARPADSHITPAVFIPSGTLELLMQRLKQEGQNYRTLRPALSFSKPFLNAKRKDEPGDLPAVPDYEILGELGRGGMGVVYLAPQRRLDRLVALKMLLSGQDAASLARFRAEAAAVARLQHPNIVQIFEIGTVEGHSFICLEYVPGGTLVQRLAAAFHCDGTRLVTGGTDHVLRVWDVNTGDALIWLEGHRGLVFSLAFSPDGRSLVSASGDQTVRLWDTFPLAERLNERAKRSKPKSSR